jgi:hypothetical protein
MHVLRLMGSVTWRVRNARYAHLLAVAFALVTAVPPLAAQRACPACLAVTAIPSGGPPVPGNDAAFVGGPPARNGDRWRFTVMPGILSPTLGGAAAAGSTLLPAYHVNLTSHEAFADPAGSGVLYIEAASGPWSIALGGTYIDRKQPITAVYQFIGTVCTPFGGGYACGAGPDSSRVTGSMTGTQSNVEGFVFRQLSAPIEVMIGATGNQVRTNTSAIVPTYGSGSGGFSTMQVDVKSHNEVWGDPVIGARWTPVDGTHWHVRLFGDAGGINHSNWTWQVLPSAGYRLDTVFELSLAYRALSTNYTAGSGTAVFKYNMTIVGPQLGLAIHI